ncbi:multidrug transporter, partial [Lactiplantibacillus plantarum]
MNVGDRMKSIRKQQGISADQLAESIGVSRSTIFRYEKGDIEKMPIEVVANVASSLHVSLIDLMGISNDSISEKITEIVSKLNTNRQQNVYNYADNQLKEQNGKVVNL